MHQTRTLVFIKMNWTIQTGIVWLSERNQDTFRSELNPLLSRQLNRICFHGRLTASRNFHGRWPAYVNRGRLSWRLRGLTVSVVVFLRKCVTQTAHHYSASEIDIRLNEPNGIQTITLSELKKNWTLRITEPNKTRTWTFRFDSHI